MPYSQGRRSGPTNLYVAAVLGSGERKPAVFADTIQPLETAEARLLVDAPR
jgi:hypothetical protein